MLFSCQRPRSVQNIGMRRLDGFWVFWLRGCFYHRVSFNCPLGPNRKHKNRGVSAAMTAQPKVVSDAVAMAEQISRALSQSGYQADFSLQSLKEVDRFFDEQTTNGQAKPGGLLSQQLGARLFAIGAYVGEVIRRQKGGQWQGDDKGSSSRDQCCRPAKYWNHIVACPTGYEAAQKWERRRQYLDIWHRCAGCWCRASMRAPAISRA